MKLSFVYVPSADLKQSVEFYRDVLGLEEAWREGSDTVAFAVPDGDTQLMVSTSATPAGPMHLVDDVARWLADHPDVPVTVPLEIIPGGSVVGLADPAGNTFYVLDQAADPQA